MDGLMPSPDTAAMRPLLQQIDWQRPWLAPFHARAAEIIAAADWRNALTDAASTLNLRNHRGLPIVFVPQSDLPSGMAYEAFISDTGAVPTRANLHDFFNALVWLTFPRIKVQLNRLQALEIARNASAPQASEQRGKLRDGATIFDENAALFVTALPDLAAKLQAHEWQPLFVQQRATLLENAEVCLFGHALLEKLVAPYKAITGHAWTIHVDHAFFAGTPEVRRAHIDAVVAAEIANGLATSDFSHLPILGVPGWWPQQSPEFYADAAVFRPKRRAHSR